jgi:hypothetical protein
MSDTKKPGKRGWRMPETKPETPGIGKAMASRHSFGRTEKIKRRNRKTWVRLANKRRRAADARATEEETP